ncbi:hypothetical protein E2C01_075456 [Portunus trituberculatus]|uniref:Uncharacterized protein n=1 Tax=Portunus trituberculatus TaxID=210409 RepID=A0A5B7IF17_PORTR|nr:hypothetical protein [Portunus trituberculatus]
MTRFTHRPSSLLAGWAGHVIPASVTVTNHVSVFLRAAVQRVLPRILRGAAINQEFLAVHSEAEGPSLGAGGQATLRRQ